MESMCVKCFQTSTNKEIMFNCSVCKNDFHFYCIGYSKQNVENVLNTNPRFTCSECQTSLKSQVNENPENVVQNNMEEIIQSISFIKIQFNNISIEISKVVDELKSIRLVNEQIITENKRLSDEIVVLHPKVEKIEQHNLGITVDILGIPRTAHENCISIVKEIGKKTNTELIVVEAYRKNSNGSTQNIIFAKLDTFEMRKNLIINARSINLTADMLRSNWPKEKVFINEHLTKSRRILFALARSVAKQKQYKFAWLSNGDILVRKNENSKIIKIKSTQDIEKL